MTGKTLALQFKETDSAGPIDLPAFAEARRGSDHRRSVNHLALGLNGHLSAAVDYVRRGFRVLPVIASGKEPAFELVPHGVRNATQDVAELKRWWERCPNANIGVTGALVIDVDPKNGGLDGLTRVLVKQNVTIAEWLRGLKTWISLTGQPRGFHVWFEMPAGISVQGKLADGVDVKAPPGGYVVAPPSVHPEGPRYRWLRGHAPWDMPLGAPDAWLIEALRKDGRADGGEVSVEFGSEVVESFAALAKAHECGAPSWALALVTFGPPAGADRSSLDASVIGALVRHGLTPTEIKALYSEYAIGEKYRERGAGEAYLARTIASVRRHSAHADDGGGDPADAGLGPEPDVRQWAIERMEPEGFTTMYYAGPGSLKTYLAILNALCTATGTPFLGHAVKQTSVLYLDWELDDLEFRRRLWEASRGLDREAPPEGVIHYMRMRGKFLEQTGRIARWVKELGVGKVIVDSFSIAGCRDPDTAIAGIQALDELGVTSVVLDHQARVQRLDSYAEKEPYGSVFKEASARAEWQVDPVRGAQPSSVLLALRNKKANFAAPQSEIGVRVTFGSRRVRFRVVDPAQTPGLEEKLSKGRRISLALLKLAPCTPEQIADQTGIAKSTVKSMLSRFKRAGQATSTEGANKHDPHRWEPMGIDFEE